MVRSTIRSQPAWCVEQVHTVPVLHLVLGARSVPKVSIKMKLEKMVASLASMEKSLLVHRATCVVSASTVPTVLQKRSAACPAARTSTKIWKVSRSAKNAREEKYQTTPPRRATNQRIQSRRTASIALRAESTLTTPTLNECCIRAWHVRPVVTA